MSTGDGNKVASDGAGKPVPHSLFDVSGLPAKQAVAAWHEAFSPYVEFKLTREPEGRLNMRTDAYHIGGVVLGTIDSDFEQHLRSRSRANAARDGADFIALYFHRSGHWQFSDDGGERLTGIGDVSILDMAEAHRTTVVKAKSHVMLVPRHLLAPLLIEPDGHNTRILSGGAPAVALLHNHVRAFHQLAREMTIGEATALLRPTLDLIAVAMNGAISEEHAGAVRMAATDRIKRYIRDNVLDRGLSPDSIAAAFGMSSRRLYQLFEPDGGVMAYVQRQRLQRIHAAITDPGQDHRTIQDMAEEHGFTHRKSFIRAFQRLYGMSPREVRAYARLGPVPRLQVLRRPRADMWQWIGNLR